jgi:hypothetical protein
VRQLRLFRLNASTLRSLQQNARTLALFHEQPIKQLQLRSYQDPNRRLCNSWAALADFTTHTSFFSISVTYLHAVRLPPPASCLPCSLLVLTTRTLFAMASKAHRRAQRKLVRITESNTQRNSGADREWTNFEMTAVMGMLCRDEHNTLDSMAFTTKLNQALKRTGGHSDQDTISDLDAEQLLSRLRDEKKAAMAFLDRQNKPEILTRAKRLVLQRSIPFTGTKTEWIAEERHDKVQAMKEKMAKKREMRASQLQPEPEPEPGRKLTFTNTYGVQIERWRPRNQSALDIEKVWGNEYALSSSTNEYCNYQSDYQNPAIHPAGQSGAGMRHSLGPCKFHYVFSLKQQRFTEHTHANFHITAMSWADPSSSARYQQFPVTGAGYQPGSSTTDSLHVPWLARADPAPGTDQVPSQYHLQLLEEHLQSTSSRGQADSSHAPPMTSGNPGVVNQQV